MTGDNVKINKSNGGSAMTVGSEGSPQVDHGFRIIEDYEHLEDMDGHRGVGSLGISTPAPVTSEGQRRG